MATWTPNYQCFEVFGTRRENWDEENPNVSVILQCKMSERYLIMADIVGNHISYPEVTPAPIYALSASIELDLACKLPDQTQELFESGYESFIQVTYGVLRGNLYNQADVGETVWPQVLFSSEDLEPSVEFLNDDYKKYGWSNSKVTGPIFAAKTGVLDVTVKPDEGFGKAFYKVAIKRMVRGFKELPIGYYDPGGLNPGDPLIEIPLIKWPGYVHNQDYTSDQTGEFFEAGTLLFTQPTIEYGPYTLKYYDNNPATPRGPVWRISAKLLYQEQGWNAFWRRVCENEEEAEGWYPLLYLGCAVSGQQKTFPIHRPHEYLDMTEFIFSLQNGAYPPTPWPPTAA